MFLVLFVSSISGRGIDSDFEISLPFADLEKALARGVAFPKLVRRVRLLRTSVATALLGVHPIVFIFTVLMYTLDGTADVSTSLACCIARHTA